MDLNDELRKMTPQLIADLTLYSTVEGGPKFTKLPGWGCICFTTKSNRIIDEDGVQRSIGYDARLFLVEPLLPGEKRRLGFVFLSGEEAARELSKVGEFFDLWEGRFVGEATVVA